MEVFFFELGRIPDTCIQLATDQMVSGESAGVAGQVELAGSLSGPEPVRFDFLPMALST